MKFILSLCLLFLPVSVFAAETQSYLNAPKLNRDVKLSKEIFEDRTKIVEETPLGDKNVAFRVRLPKAWEKLQVAAAQKDEQGAPVVIGELSRYLGPAQLDIRSSFRVQAFNLDFAVTAKNWFINYLMTNNYALQGLDESGPLRVQAHYVTVENGTQYVIRAVAQVSGPRILLAEYSVPIEAWPQERDFAIRGMASFVLTSPDLSPAEPIGSHSFANVAKFDYPQSWVIAAPTVRTVERMTATLANFKGAQVVRLRQDFDPDSVLLDGRIDIAVVAKSPGVSLAGEVQTLRQSLTQKGLVLGALIEPVSGWKTATGVTLRGIEVYKLNNMQNRLIEYEEWVGLLETPTHIYLVNLLSLGRNENFYTWVQNQEAYKMVIASIGALN